MHTNVRRTRRSGQAGYGRAVAHGVNTMTGSAKPRRPDGASWLAGADSRCLWVVLAAGGCERSRSRWWWPMNPIEKAIRRVDALQQRHKAPAFVVGLIKKYGDDNGGVLVANLAHSGFVSLFPLLLVLVTLLGLVASH